MNDSRRDRLQCVCGTVGFERKQWSEEYYPQKCPSDWRMAYFMNDFRAVYLVATDWFENAALIEQIIEELEGNFELVLQWPAAITPQAIDETLKRLEPLKQNIACMVLQTGGQSPAQLKQCMQKLTGYYSLSLDCLSLVSAEIRLLAEQFGAGIVWRGDVEAAILTTGEYQLVLSPCPDLRHGSAMLKALQNTRADWLRIGLFLEAAPQSPQRALELRTVVELLGMA